MSKPQTAGTRAGKLSAEESKPSQESSDVISTSALEDPTSWNALDFNAASVAPDNALAELPTARPPVPLLSQREVHALLGEQMNDNIEAMEGLMLEHDQVDIPVTERFINGMYAREIVIPRGTLLTGRVHKFPYVDIMLSGDIEVATPEGVKRLQGVNIQEGQPGRKRAGYAYADTRWITVHRTDLESPGDMVDQLTFFSLGEFSAWKAIQHQGGE